MADQLGELKTSRSKFLLIRFPSILALNGCVCSIFRVGHASVCLSATELDATRGKQDKNGNTFFLSGRAGPGQSTAATTKKTRKPYVVVYVASAGAGEASDEAWIKVVVFLFLFSFSLLFRSCN